jgi:protein-S-isoprenylcysteine O-methyltransferase Ste14
MGKRGEGWFLLQLALFGLILVAPRIHVFAFPLWLRVLGLLILGAGGVLGTAGTLALGRNLTPFPRPKEGGYLVSQGAYGIVRHPIYAGLILGTLGWAIWNANVLGIMLAFALLVFFGLKSQREERWLLEAYPDYGAYRRRVKRLIPWLF